MSIKVRVGKNGIPYCKTLGSSHAAGNRPIVWDLETAGYRFLGLSGLPMPTFVLKDKQDKKITYDNDNKSTDDPTDYSYEIVVQNIASQELTIGKAIIRNDPGIA